jgi:hypothetical protein
MPREDLDPEERGKITQMVRSPGWRVTVERLLAPQLGDLAGRIESPGLDERTRQYFIGYKKALETFLANQYRIAGLENPFERHYQAFLRTVSAQAGEERPVAPEPADTADLAAGDADQPVGPERVSFPV